MKTAVESRFNQDYAQLRKLLLRGEYTGKSLEMARKWVCDRGKEVANAAELETEIRQIRRWSTLFQEGDWRIEWERIHQTL